MNAEPSPLLLGHWLPATHQLQINTNPLCIHFVLVVSGTVFLFPIPTNTHLLILKLIMWILVNQLHRALLPSLHSFWDPLNIHNKELC